MSSPGTRSAEKAALARVGMTLRGRFTIERLLGVGGTAAVYEAKHRNGNRVAIKVLHPHLSADEAVRTRFLREGYAANKVDHPGVVRVLDDESTGDTVYLVMELLDGDTLESRSQRTHGVLPPLEVLEAANQVLDVLSSAHDRGILHRDIKPENIFVCANGKAKILDFGIARLRDLTDSTGRTATRNGIAMGTPAYMPPEQALGRADLVDARSDLWSLGATMFTLITGKFVHDGLTGNEQLVRAATQPAPKLAEVIPGVPEELSEVVDRALSFDKEARWEDARAMRAAVVSAAAKLSSDPEKPEWLVTYGRVDHSAVGRAEVTTVRGQGPAQITTGGVVTGAAIAKRPPNRTKRNLALALAGVAVLLLIFFLAGRRPEPTPDTPAAVAPTASASDTTSSSAAPEPSASASPSIPVVEPDSLAPADSSDHKKPSSHHPRGPTPSAGNIYDRRN